MEKDKLLMINNFSFSFNVFSCVSKFVLSSFQMLPSLLKMVSKQTALEISCRVNGETFWPGYRFLDAHRVFQSFFYFSRFSKDISDLKKFRLTNLYWFYLMQTHYEAYATGNFWKHCDKRGNRSSRAVFSFSTMI